MVSTQCAALLAQLIDMVDTACQACLALMQQYNCGDENGSAVLLADLRAAAQTIDRVQEPLLPQLEHAQAKEMAENIADTLDDIEKAMAIKDRDKALMLMEFQLFPFLRLQKESLYFWGSIFPDKKRMDQYYREEFAPHYRNLYLQDGDPTPPPYQLSIFVIGYNHLEVTKQCVAQLLKETDFEALNAELILIDHGSSDGTREYFESLHTGKVIHLKKNIRTYMISLMAQICQGEYLCSVSNDVLVTAHWADILLQCMASDPRIIMAVPTTPNITNLQKEQFPTTDPQEFIAWANEQNRSDPTLWSDRARLMPPLGMYRAEDVSRLGFADPYFYSMEFQDDDFSLRARRAGYRQILCSDVACYHFGSVTGKEAQTKEGTLIYGRELFRKKHGVDPWDTGFCYLPPVIEFLERKLPAKGPVDLLAVDCGFGDTPLQLRSRMRRQNRACRLYQLTTQKEYLPDLTPLSDEVRFVPQMAEGIAEEFDGKLFTAAYLGRDIACYEDFPALLALLSARLVPGGVLVFTCQNPFYFDNILALLHFSLPDDSAQCTFADPDKARKEAEKYFSNVQMAHEEKTTEPMKEFAKKMYGETEIFPQILTRLNRKNYYFACVK